MLLYQIGLTLLPEIGHITGKKLVAYCGGVEEIFRAKRKELEKIPGISARMVHSIVNHDVFKRAEEEIAFVEKNKIQTLFFLDEKYPNRLKNCSDSPLLMYFKGEVNFNLPKVIAVVGTRNPTENGKAICEKIIGEIASPDLIVVSGLAYGIDGIAHKSALQNNVQTVGVLGHGLDMLYPAAHRKMAIQMLENGGLLTEFMQKTKPDRQNFPMRNRIVAGMVDCVLVVESGEKGGSLITAMLAMDYNRDVLAIPGRPNDEFSTGCNRMIQNNKAQLVMNGSDILRIMGWEEKKQKKAPQRQLFVQLDENEAKIMTILKDQETHGIDFICSESLMSMSLTSATLLNLEFKGLLRSMPGKMYVLA